MIRDGLKKTIPAEDLVVGDVIEVKFGDRMPADVRVTFAQSWKVNTNLYLLATSNSGAIFRA